MPEYPIVYEQTSTGWSAYAPDLAGPGVAGSSFEATEELIGEAVSFHIEGLLADGDHVPEPTKRVDRIPILTGMP